MAQINLKYKIEDRYSKITFDVIESLGFDSAMHLAYNKAINVLEENQESILSVMLLAWSHNLLTDARAAPENQEAQKLLQLSSFYRKLAHKVYQYQRENDLIAMLPVFLQAIE